MFYWNFYQWSLCFDDHSKQIRVKHHQRSVIALVLILQNKRPDRTTLSAPEYLNIRRSDIIVILSCSSQTWVHKPFSHFHHFHVKNDDCSDFDRLSSQMPGQIIITVNLTDHWWWSIFFFFWTICAIWWILSTVKWVNKHLKILSYS